MTKKSVTEFLKTFDPQVSEAIGVLSANFPELANPFVERLYGDLYQRDTLTLRERLLITIAMLAASDKTDLQLPMQLGIALKQGVRREELMEIALQISVFCGFASAMRLAITIDTLADEFEISQSLKTSV
jgi:4-carboxymuconolactone decarboxylase